MHVVGHHDEIPDVVCPAIIGENLCSDSFKTLAAPQVTRTESAIQAALNLAVEVFVKSESFRLGQFFTGSTPAASFAVVKNTARLQPQTLLLFPLAADGFGDRIS
jgi:hypothetical protein